VAREASRRDETSKLAGVKGTDVGDVHLTGRERQVLSLLAMGRQLDEIALELGIGSETVRTHLRNASRRLGAANRTHAVAIAIRRQLI
jgi:LuxR family quorum sensing-dependent transcriptional regulator